MECVLRRLAIVRKEESTASSLTFWIKSRRHSSVTNEGVLLRIFRLTDTNRVWHSEEL